jgi:LysM repeat protein
MKNKPLANTYAFMALITGLLITVSYSAELDQPKKIEIQKAPIAPKKWHANSAGRYIVVTGDSYSRIAKQCNVDERALRALNDNVNLRPGRVLDLPAVSGDSVSALIVAKKNTLKGSAEIIYVDAVDNCLGPNGGTYKRIGVERNATYQLSINRANAVFNKNDGAKFVNIGVGYVEPPRKMMIKTIELGKRTYVKSEGALWFFLVDDAGLNKGGFEIEVKKISASKPYIVTLANLKELKLKKKEALQRGSLIEATAYDEELIKMAFILAGETPGASIADKKLRPSDLEEMGLLNRTVFIESSATKRFLFSDGKSLKGEGRKAIEMMRGAEGGWVNHVEHGNFNVVGSDANYYNRAGWVIKQSGDAFILENIETKRYLLSDGKPTDGRRGNEGGLLDCFGNNNSNVVGADANYLDRALWDIYKIGGDFIFESKATKRYLFSDGEPIKGKRGVEGSWRHSPNVIGADANYENRAFWKISPQKKG